MDFLRAASCVSSLSVSAKRRFRARRTAILQSSSSSVGLRQFLEQSVCFQRASNRDGAPIFSPVEAPLSIPYQCARKALREPCTADVLPNSPAALFRYCASVACDDSKDESLIRAINTPVPPDEFDWNIDAPVFVPRQQRSVDIDLKDFTFYLEEEDLSSRLAFRVPANPRKRKISRRADCSSWNPSFGGSLALTWKRSNMITEPESDIHDTSAANFGNTHVSKGERALVDHRSSLIAHFNYLRCSIVEQHFVNMFASFLEDTWVEELELADRMIDSAFVHQPYDALMETLRAVSPIHIALPENLDERMPWNRGQLQHEFRKLGEHIRLRHACAETKVQSPPSINRDKVISDNLAVNVKRNWDKFNMDLLAYFRKYASDGEGQPITSKFERDVLSILENANLMNPRRMPMLSHIASKADEVRDKVVSLQWFSDVLFIISREMAKDVEQLSAA